jgi:hypothetical protein
MSGADFEYDVAISFLAVDEPLANRLHASLQPPLRVFVFSKVQEELAGTDGAESFREVFRHRSRVAVVLFRSGWGETRFTRVEATAIKDYCLDAGWDRMLFVRLSAEGELPKWVPESNVYLDLQRFSFDDLIGVVKLKASQLGATLRALTPAERAGTIAAREAFDEETKELLRRSPAPFHQAATTLFETLEQHCGEMERTTGWAIVHTGSSRNYYLIVTRDVSLQLLPENVYANRAAGSVLTVRLFNGRVLSQEEREGGVWVLDEAQEIRSFRLQLDRELNVGWCWKYGGRALTNDAAAELVIGELLKEVQRPRRRD